MIHWNLQSKNNLTLTYTIEELNMSNNPIRTTNPNVPYYWQRSMAARSGNGQFSTDGQTLYSYRKPIGKTIDGRKVLFLYTAADGNYVSATTSQHVGLAKRHCNSHWATDRSDFESR